MCACTIKEYWLVFLKIIMESLVMSHWNIESITIKRFNRLNLGIGCLARGKVRCGFFLAPAFALTGRASLQATAKLILNSLIV